MEDPQLVTQRRVCQRAGCCCRRRHRLGCPAGPRRTGCTSTAKRTACVSSPEKCRTLSQVGPVGVEPTSNRVSDGRLAARSPARIDSALYGSRTRLACSTGRSPHPLRHRAERVSGGSRTRLSTMARWCLGCSATDTKSKDGRSRTLYVRVGAALLSQEHVLNRSQESGFRSQQSIQPVTPDP